MIKWDDLTAYEKLSIARYAELTEAELKKSGAPLWIHIPEKVREKLYKVDWFAVIGVKQ